MNRLIEAAEGLIDAFNKCEEIPGYKFLELQVAIMDAKSKADQQELLIDQAFVKGKLEGLAEGKKIVKEAFQNA